MISGPIVFGLFGLGVGVLGVLYALRESARWRRNEGEIVARLMACMAAVTPGQARAFGMRQAVDWSDEQLATWCTLYITCGYRYAGKVEPEGEHS